MADTKRTVLYLDTDAADLLAILAPSENRRGKYVSGLIRAAAQAQAAAPESTERARLQEEIARLVTELTQAADRLRALENSG